MTGERLGGAGGREVAVVPSPCIGVCILDAAQVCIGCRRTIDEIARWSSMSNEERRAVVLRVSSTQSGDPS
jgi:uncharacterized protein